MWRYSGLVSGGGGTPTPSPIEPNLAFAQVGVTAGVIAITPNATANADGAPQLLGTLSSAIDGLVMTMVPTGSSRYHWLNILADGVAVVTKFPISGRSGPAWKRIPIRIGAGKALTATLACETAAAAALDFAFNPYTADAQTAVTSIAALGSAPTVLAMGSQVDLGTSAGVTTSWQQIGILVSASKGIATINLHSGGDNARTTGEILVEIGVGASTAEVTLVGPFLAYVTANEVKFPDIGPLFMDLPSGTRLSFRATPLAATAGDKLNCQLAMMYP